LTLFEGKLKSTGNKDSALVCSKYQ